MPGIACQLDELYLHTTQQALPFFGVKAAKHGAKLTMHVLLHLHHAQCIKSNGRSANRIIQRPGHLSCRECLSAAAQCITSWSDSDAACPISMQALIQFEDTTHLPRSIP